MYGYSPGKEQVKRILKKEDVFEVQSVQNCSRSYSFSFAADTDSVT